MLNKNSVNFNYSVQKNIFIRNNFIKSENCKIHKVKRNFLAKNLNKSDLEFLKLIGQFDRKFLIMMNMRNNNITIFDQHAIHERILFEFYTTLLSNQLNISNISDTTNSGKLILNKSSKKRNLSKFNVFIDLFSKLYLKFPMIITKRIDEFQFNLEFDTSKINNLFNFEFLIVDNKIKIYSVPIIFDKIFPEEFYKETFLKILENLNDILIDNSGVVKIFNMNILLDIFMPVIKSKACRDAVKFNEELDGDFLQSLLENLQDCKNPFLCAHGRHNFFILNQKKN